MNTVDMTVERTMQCLVLLSQYVVWFNNLSNLLLILFSDWAIAELFVFLVSSIFSSYSFSHGLLVDFQITS